MGSRREPAALVGSRRPGEDGDRANRGANERFEDVAQHSLLNKPEYSKGAKCDSVTLE